MKYTPLGPDLGRWRVAGGHLCTLVLLTVSAGSDKNGVFLGRPVVGQHADGLKLRVVEKELSSEVIDHDPPSSFDHGEDRLLRYKPVSQLTQPCFLGGNQSSNEEFEDRHGGSLKMLTHSHLQRCYRPELHGGSSVNDF